MSANYRIGKLSVGGLSFGGLSEDDFTDMEIRSKFYDHA